MTALSTETQVPEAETVHPTSPFADQPRLTGRPEYGSDDRTPPRPNFVHEQGVPVADPSADMWDEGRVAARSKNHEKALVCFVREAEARSAQEAHGRAAVAFRAAAEQARLQGFAEAGDQLLYRAAAAYTHAAERSELAPTAVHQAWISAAKCFLQLQQLDRAAWCIEEARGVAGETSRRRDTVQAAT